MLLCLVHAGCALLDSTRSSVKVELERHIKHLRELESRKFQRTWASAHVAGANYIGAAGKDLDILFSH